MSTKATISVDKAYHLYHDVLDSFDDQVEGRVFLDIYNPKDFSASLGKVTINLPIEQMQKLCKDFLEKHPPLWDDGNVSSYSSDLEMLIELGRDDLWYVSDCAGDMSTRYSEGFTDRDEAKAFAKKAVTESHNTSATSVWGID